MPSDAFCVRLNKLNSLCELTDTENEVAVIAARLLPIVAMEVIKAVKPDRGHT
jgi:hypothetical protein